MHVCDTLLTLPVHQRSLCVPRYPMKPQGRVSRLSCPGWHPHPSLATNWKVRSVRNATTVSVQTRTFPLGWFPDATRPPYQALGHSPQTLSPAVSPRDPSTPSAKGKRTVLRAIPVASRGDRLKVRIGLAVRAARPGRRLRGRAVPRARVPGVRRECGDLARAERSDRLACLQTRGGRCPDGGGKQGQESCTEGESKHDCSGSGSGDCSLSRGVR